MTTTSDRGPGPDAPAAASPTRPPRRAARDSLPWLLPLLVVLLLGMRQTFRVPHTGLGASPAQLLVLGCSALLVAGLLARDRAVASTRHPLAVLLVLQLVVAVIGWGYASRTVAVPSPADDPATALLSSLTLGLLSLYTMSVLTTAARVRLLLRWTTAASGVAALVALASAATGVDVAAALKPPGFTVATQLTDLLYGLDREGVTRTQGTSGHPLELGAVMTLLVPLALGTGFDARRRGERSWPYFAVAVLCAGSAIASVSRSSVVGLAAALLAMGLLWPLRRALVTAAVTVALGVASLVVLAGPATALLSIVTAGDPDSSLQSRALGQAYVLRELASSPLLGQGPGLVGADQPVLDNDYLTTLLSGGVVALALSVAVLLLAVGAAVRSRRARDHGELAVGVVGALVALAVVRLILDVGGFVQISTMAALLVGVAGALAMLPRDEQPARRPLGDDAAAPRDRQPTAASRPVRGRTGSGATAAAARRG